MERLKDVVQFLKALGREPEGCETKELGDFKALTQECCAADCDPSAVVEALGDAVRNLCSADIESGSSFIHVLLEHGLLELVRQILKNAIETSHSRGDTSQILGLMDIICVMSDTSSKVKILLAEAFSVQFLDEVFRNISHHYTIEVVTYINLLLEHCPIQCREKLIEDSRIEQILQKVANIIYTVGDFEIQVVVMECLFRFVPRRHRAAFAGKFFSDDKTAQHFLDVRDSHFETDCRVFINGLNSQLTSKTKVYSYPCLTAQMGTKELTKPCDDSYSDFWVDFNAGRSRMSLFCEQDTTDSQGEESGWETVSIWKEDIRSYNLNVKKCPVTLTLSLKSSLEECAPNVCAGQKETYAIISFDSSLSSAISEALLNCYGRELDWAKSKEQSCKASKAATPVHLKRQHNRLELLSETDVEEICSSPEDSNTAVPERPNEQVIVPRYRSSSSFQKVSVPAQPMRTPARLTVSEIHMKTLMQTATPSKSPANNAVKHPTPSREKSHQPVKHSPSVKDDKAKTSKSKGVPTPKTPVGKRTRSGGKVKTPLVLQTITTPVGKQKKSRSLEGATVPVDEDSKLDGSETDDKQVKDQHGKNKFDPTTPVPDDQPCAKTSDAACKRPGKTRTNKAVIHSLSDVELESVHATSDICCDKPAKSKLRKNKLVESATSCDEEAKTVPTEMVDKPGKHRKKKIEEKTLVFEEELVDAEMTDVLPCDKIVKGKQRKKNGVETYPVHEQDPKCVSSEMAKTPSNIQDTAFCPDVLTIPDSLPMDNQSHTTVDQPGLKKMENKKNLNDSGISVHDTSDQEKERSFTDKLKETETYEDSLVLPKKHTAEGNSVNSVSNSRTLQKESVEDKLSGEILIESSVECSVTFPKRNLRSRPVSSSPISVVEDSQIPSPIHSPDKTEVWEESPPPVPKGRKGNQKKGKASPKKKSKVKEKAVNKSEKSTVLSSKTGLLAETDFRHNLFDSQSSTNSLEEFPAIFSKQKPRKGLPNTTLPRPSIGKMPVYNSVVSPSKANRKSKNDPYDFDEIGSKVSSVYGFNKKDLAKPKPNKIFKSRNKKYEEAEKSKFDYQTDIDVAFCKQKSRNKKLYKNAKKSKYDYQTDTEVAFCKLQMGSTMMNSEIDKSFRSEQIGFKQEAKKSPGLRPLTHWEKGCFGFESPSKMEYENPQSPIDIQSKDITSTLEGQDLRTEKTNTPPPVGSASKMRSANHYQLLTLQKIKEKVEQAGLHSKKSLSSIVLNYMSPLAKGVDDIGCESDAEDQIEDKPSPVAQQTSQFAKKSSSQKGKTKIQQKSPSSGSDHSEDVESSDDKIISNFKNICKGIVAESAASKPKRERRCKQQPVAYKDVSDSDLEEMQQTPEVDVDKAATKSVGDIDVYEANMDTRSELSWMGSQRKRKKSPVKTYKHKAHQRSNPLEEKSHSFDFKTLCPTSMDNLTTFEDMTKKLAAMQSEKNFTFNKELPDDHGDTESDDEVADNDCLKNDPLLDIGSKYLTFNITPLKLKEQSETGDEENDVQLHVDLTSPEQKNYEIFGFRDTSSDEKDLDKAEIIPTNPRTPDAAQRDAELRTMSEDSALNIGTPVAPDPWNVEYSVLTPMSTLLPPEEEPSAPPIDIPKPQMRGFISGPSSSKRLTKSASKRKYEEYLQEDSEDNESDGSEGIEENPSLNSPDHTALQPRKLFKTDQKAGPPSHDRNAFNCFESTSASNRSFSSDESCHMDTENRSLQNGVSAFIKTFGVDIQKQITEKRRRLDQLTKGATKATQKHLASVWAQQSENRARLMGELKENMLLELIELEKDVKRLNDAEEQTVDFFKRQLSVLQSCRKSQEQRLKNLKRLHHGYGKGMEEMAATEKQEHVLVRENLKSELVALHRKLLRDTQQQEMGKFRRSLKSLI